MGAIAFNNMAAFAVTYNGVQFGGNDAGYKSLPPEYTLKGDFVYDDSGRAVIRTRYLLTISTVFYENTEVTMGGAHTDVRELLSAPGKTLSIIGLGTGFGTITYDTNYGPKPVSFDWRPLGQIAWQCVWTVEFHTTECIAGSVWPALAWMAFNFETTWQNDFEGMCERTISGYIQIAPVRVGANSKQILATVDQTRNTLVVLCPPHFRRIRNVWRENSAKDRLEFVITDAAERGDPLPEGCITADGSLTYHSPGPGFAKAFVTLNMNLRISPLFPPGLAGAIFLAAVKAKQELMTASNLNNAVVIPHSMTITSGKFERARDTQASFTWRLTRCVGSMMRAAGIWEPMPKASGGAIHTYPLWRASVESLWGNRGLHGLGSVTSEGAIIDLCDGVRGAVIGNTNSFHEPSTGQPEFIFACPEIPEDGGWIAHDLRVRVLRKDEQTWHKKALAYIAGGPQAFVDSLAERIGLGGPSYTQQGDNQQHDVEYNGYPEVYILLEFRGLRFIRKPIMPELIRVDGLELTMVKQDIDGPRSAYDALGCPVYFIRGYKIYRVNGPVNTIATGKSKTSCGAYDPNESNQHEY